MSSLIFQAIDWLVTDYEEFNEDEEDSINIKYLIKIFGRDINGNHISVNVKDYPCYFYVKGIDNLQGIKNSNNIKDSAHNNILYQLQNHIENNLPNKYKNSIKKCKIVRKKDIWGFTNNKSFKFIFLSFTNYKAMKIASNLFLKAISLGSFKNLKFQLYENNIEPYLQFVHKQDLQISGWLQVNENKYTDTYEFNVKTGKNYNVSWKDVKPYQSSNIASFIIGSYDIECNSYDGSFPCAIKTYDTFVHGLLDYHNSLNNEIKEIKQEKIFQYILNKLQDNTMNFKEKLNIDKITEILYIQIEDIVSILKGKLQFEKESIKRNKIKNLSSYFQFDNHVEEGND